MKNIEASLMGFITSLAPQGTVEPHVVYGKPHSHADLPLALAGLYFYQGGVVLSRAERNGSEGGLRAIAAFKNLLPPSEWSHDNLVEPDRGMWKLLMEMGAPFMVMAIYGDGQEVTEQSDYLLWLSHGDNPGYYMRLLQQAIRDDENTVDQST